VAGLANPFTEEGIGPAIESGELAAGAAARCGTDASARYQEDLRGLLPQRFTMRSALRRMYEQPGLLLERGDDVVVVPSGLAGAGLRRLLWDSLASRRRDRELDATLLLLAEVRSEIISIGRRLRPLLGELLATIVDDPTCQFGWATLVAASLRQREIADAGPWTRDSRDALGTLEILNLVLRLNCEIRSAPGEHERSWGRNTLSLILADSLTAHALRTLHSGGRWSRPVAEAARYLFRRHAERGVQQGRACSNEQSSVGSLLHVAARIGVGDLPDRRLAGNVESDVDLVAGLYATVLPDDEEGPLRRLRAHAETTPGGWLAQLAELLDRAGAGRTADGPRVRPGAARVAGGRF
jgi:hypothetical protein